ncbi:MAG: DUF481 domain-containing protein [Gammaproteobacteria bacterium]|nr:DUF481 domain-containing protein [Gammaproteobacteria bacterium]
MLKYSWRSLIVAASLLSGNAFAQQAGDINTEIELGAIFTSGNTEEENVSYGVTVDWLQENWEYQFTSDGLRNSRFGDVTAQRFYHVARGRRELDETSYLSIRGAYEDDRFNGYDYQADATVSYGRVWLNDRDNMSLSTDIGPGFRRSVTDFDEFNELIVRAAGEYLWNLSDNANFFQNLSAEVGEDTSIYRSETGVESALMENLSLRFSINIRHQTEVPAGLEKTDTATAVTVVWSF